MGLGLIIGLSDLLPRAEDVEARLQQFASLDTTILATFNRAITQLQQGKLSEAEMVRILEQEVLPPWRAQREALHQLTTLSRLPTRQKRLVATLVEYMTARQEGWELLREGLRSMTRAPSRGPTRNSGRPTRSLVKEALRQRDQGPRRNVDYAIAGMTLAMRSRNGSASARRRGATSTTRATPRSR